MASYLCFTSLVIFCLFNASFVTTMTVDFDQFPLRYGHLNWLLQDARLVNGENVTGFNYESGSGPGERPDQHGVTWPNQSYYDTVLGAGGFDHVRTWPMKALVLYAQEKPGGWATDGCYNSATGKPSSYLKNITREWTTSTQELTDNNARQLWALAVGLQMMQKVKLSSPGQVFSADDSTFAAFLENHANHVMNNILKYEISEFDNRLASFFLIGYDKRPNQSDIYVMMDKAINKITSCQFRSSDWRNGIFVDNANTGDWQAWGQL